MTNEDRAQAEANKAIMQRLYAAVGNDPETVMSLMDPDLVLVRPSGHPVGGTFAGRAAGGEARQRTHELLGVMKAEIKEIIADGPERVVVVMELSGTDKSGEPWTMRAVELTNIVDGRIVKIELFTDTARLHEFVRTEVA